MKYRKRIYYSPEQRALIWDRYKQGDSLHEIGNLFDRPHSSMMKVIYATGGFRPPEIKRYPQALTLSEREEISRGLATNLSLREIVKQLCRAPSTISREVKRHGGIKDYRATTADSNAWENAKRPKACKLKTNPKLCYVVAQKLKLSWSPEQVAGWLKREYPNNLDMQVSHETIYKTLYIQTRGALKKELQKCLRTKRVVRKSRTTTLKGKGLGKIVDAIPISERPAEVEDRAIPGHWEGDLIQGSNNTFIATLV
jgi:IS30 family transposase